MVLYLLLTGAAFKEIVILASIFAFAGYRTLPALQQIYRASAKLKFTEIVAETLIGDLDKDKAGIAFSSDSNVEVKLNDAIALRDVSFSYSERNSEVLQNVTLEINKGSFVAVVGRTGSGKTTLVDLMLGLLEPSSGQFFVDKVKIDQSSAPSWRRQVGYVPQQIFLSDDTLASNIALGIPQNLIDLEKVKRAASIAQVEEFLDQLPDGFNTLIGERGVRLSGGQRQRVGIARAIYSSPSILILDEATSSLDSITERAVMDAIEQLRGDMTIIVVAHRLSTVMSSEEIYVFDSGSLVDHGSYKDLVKNSDLFQELASMFEEESSK
jgi:ABC-type multidrug transport system fused ATPase/permease subunit